MQAISSIAQVLDTCDGVLLDQFGVLHDGRTPYPHAIAAVRQLAEAGKQVVILSNSSRRSGGTIGKLANMGFKEEWFAGAVTSGELTHRYLSTRPDPWWQQLGRRCIHITWSSRGAISLDGLGLQVVVAPHEADFLLAHGTEALGLPDGGTLDVDLDQLQQLLQRCAEEGRQRGAPLPMVVANPDLVTVDGPAGLITMPGTLARWYKQAGGEVRLMGKPDPIIYTAAQQLVAGGAGGGNSNGSSSSQSPQPQRWLAIGDSLEHDIHGAACAGLQTLFVVGGIHAQDAKLEGSAAAGNHDSGWDDAALRRLCAEHGVLPDFCMAYLSEV